jgi:1,4-dihydroxy-2-naphthoyl-CoA synthase
MMPTMELARQSLLRLAGGEEMTEGASAFMEKRKPDFRLFRK